jgi:hypothetical protein
MEPIYICFVVTAAVVAELTVRELRVNASKYTLGALIVKVELVVFKRPDWSKRELTVRTRACNEDVTIAPSLLLIKALCALNVLMSGALICE